MEVSGKGTREAPGHAEDAIHALGTREAPGTPRTPSTHRAHGRLPARRRRHPGTGTREAPGMPRTPSTHQAHVSLPGTLRTPSRHRHMGGSRAQAHGAPVSRRSRCCAEAGLSRRQGECRNGSRACPVLRAAPTWRSDVS